MGSHARRSRMNFTNINDPAGVKALLEQLRSSQAWQEALQSQPANAAGPSGTPGTTTQSHPVQAAHPSAAANLVDGHEPSTPLPSAEASGDPPDAPSHSVASLLSQLQSTAIPAASGPEPLPPHAITPQILPASSPLPPAPAPPHHVLADTSAPLPSPARREDLRSLSFQQALPHLARLAEDSSFVDAISTMRREQADLERQLWDERRAIVRKHEERVKVACTKASLVGGAGVTPYEADMMSDAFRQELRKFDAQRVLPAWDGLVAKQQARLEALGVPAMFPTTAKSDRERQQRVIQVLLGIAGNDDS